jgi:V/A-type H+-transporting ATPase subunit E
MDQVTELESAILARARRLASEYRERAERSRDNILRDAHERLHLREEREVLVAKAQAERSYLRKVQASELKLHKEMDHLCWNLVEGVKERLSDRIEEFAGAQDEYLRLLQQFLAKGAALIERDDLVVEVSARDLERLQPIWENFSRAAAADKRIRLSTTPITTRGGLLLRSEDNRIRIDNTYEGRVDRLGGKLHQVIIERLLPNGITQAALGGQT